MTSEIERLASAIRLVGSEAGPVRPVVHQASTAGSRLAVKAHAASPSAGSAVAQALQDAAKHSRLAADALAHFAAEADAFARRLATGTATEQQSGSAQACAVGANSADWQYDTKGRLTRASASLRMSLFSTKERKQDKDEAKAQRLVPGRRTGDHAGHAIAYRFLGGQGLSNLFAQEGNFNVSAYKSLENFWARQTEVGRTVEVTISLIHSLDSPRPDELEVRFQIIGEHGPRDFAYFFENEPGQSIPTLPNYP